jgi:site-specific DNA-methyltransferase (adenine-specific)
MEKVGDFEINKIYCIDCLEGLKKMQDKSISLIITDPPYGIGMTSDGFGGSKNADKTIYIKTSDWDKQTPSKEVFDEILRVGKKVIIFGGNYFLDKLPKGSLHIWDKRCGITPSRTYADGEFIWCNFNEPLRIYRFLWDGFIQDKRNTKKEVRVHPTHKPVLLMKDLIQKYSKEDDIIMDVFVGGGVLW